MTKPRLNIHDFSRSNHIAVATAIREALSASRDYDTDGVIVIISSKKQSEPFIRLAGRLAQPDKAMQQLYRLHLSLAVGDAQNDPMQ